jgi:hypothetical protein
LAALASSFCAFQPTPTSWSATADAYSPVIVPIAALGSERRIVPRSPHF